jgi:hypothetical protein
VQARHGEEAGATAKTGKVLKQGTKAGAKLAVGAKVKLTLKPYLPALLVIQA